MTRCWLAFTTPPQKERAAEEDLRQIGFRVQLPTVEKMRVVRGKRSIVAVPALRGYIFVEFPPGEVENKRLHIVIASKFVNKVVGFPGGRAGRISERIMADFVAGLAEFEVIRPRDDQMYLRPGSQVQIKMGAFADLNGAVMSGCNDRSVRVLVDLFSRSFEVNVSPLQLKEYATDGLKTSSREKRRLQGARKSGSVHLG